MSVAWTSRLSHRIDRLAEAVSPRWHASRLRDMVYHLSELGRLTAFDVWTSEEVLAGRCGCQLACRDPASARHPAVTKQRKRHARLSRSSSPAETPRSCEATPA
jgi:hypothetical protein